jgi:hypothetical protein
LFCLSGFETEISSPIEVFFDGPGPVPNGCQISISFDEHPAIKMLSDFILGMKHLSYLQIANIPKFDNSNYDRLKILGDQVNELILPLRPNFKLIFSH